jgi:hypothetical protein
MAYTSINDLLAKGCLDFTVGVALGVHINCAKVSTRKRELLDGLMQLSSECGQIESASSTDMFCSRWQSNGITTHRGGRQY